jgi:hypothetical protein
MPKNIRFFKAGNLNKKRGFHFKVALFLEALFPNIQGVPGADPLYMAYKKN